MKLLQQFSLALFAILLVSACVPSKKYKALESQSYANKRETDSLRNVVDKNRHLKFEIKRLESAIEKDKSSLQKIQDRFSALSLNNQDLLVRYNQLLAQNGDLLNTSSSEKQTLTEELAAKQTELDQKARDLRRLEDDLKLQQQNLQVMQDALQAKQDQLNGVDGQFDDYKTQVQQLQALIQQKDATLMALRQSVNQALLGFTDSDLQVSEKNGKVYVSMSQNLLFASGSDHIDWKGKKAIIQVAQVLKSNPDILVNVEGHTDSDGSASSNWDLSVRRSTAVVNVLTGQGVPPGRITASGRAMYDPVAPNNSSANKAKNRRTEIILTPKLDQLYQIINQ